MEFVANQTSAKKASPGLMKVSEENIIANFNATPKRDFLRPNAQSGTNSQ